MDFPVSNFSIQTFTLAVSFGSLYYIISVKIHLHYLHITGKIHGYGYNFSISRFKRTKNFYPIWLIIYLIFTFILWCKAHVFLFGNSNLTNQNFANLGNQTKYIDTLKYYQQGLVQLAASITSEEKSAVKRVTRQFICEHDYFSRVWQILSETTQEKILEMVVAGKDVIPYGKISTFNNLDSVPEKKSFFEISEFHSEQI